MRRTRSVWIGFLPVVRGSVAAVGVRGGRDGAGGAAHDVLRGHRGRRRVLALRRRVGAAGYDLSVLGIIGLGGDSIEFYRETKELLRAGQCE